MVRGIRFEFIEGAAEVASMRIDGAPWKKIPLDGLVEIEISYHCQVNILARPDFPAKSIHDLSQPGALKILYDDNNAEGYSEEHKKFDAASTSKIPCDDNNAEDYSEAQKKFGAASTSKIP